MNKNTIIGILVVIVIIILGYMFFWNDVTAPAETLPQDSDLPDRSGGTDVDTSGTVQLQY